MLTWLMVYWMAEGKLCETHLFYSFRPCSLHGKLYIWKTAFACSHMLCVECLEIKFIKIAGDDHMAIISAYNKYRWLFITSMVVKIQ